MPDATQGALRYLRGTLLGLVVAMTTLVGHSTGHGELTLVPALLVVGLAVAGALTGRRLRPAALLPFVAGFQVAAHWVLSHAPSRPGGTLLGHAHDGSTGAVGRQVWSEPVRPELGWSEAGSWVPQLDLPMLGGHAVAGLIIVGLVWRADAALFAFATALRRAIDVVLGGGFWAVPRPVTRTARRLFTADAPAPGQALCHPSPWQHRGPPVPALAC